VNEVIKTLTNHRSIRKYKSDMVNDKDLDMIINAAQSAPSSINGQQMSIVAVKNPKTKSKIAHLCGDQKWIDEGPVFLVFLSDFYRAKIGAEKNNLDLIITQNTESTLVGAIDVGLAMGNAIAAAESLGLSIVPIGAIRMNPDEIIDILDLPEYVFPMCGLVVGYADEESAKKPRFPKEAVYHEETYNRDIKHIIDKYDDQVSEYMKKRTNGESDRNWSQTVSSIYKSVYFPKVSPALKKQKYENK
jgi:FMN reductase [NAD(P)H]